MNKAQNRIACDKKVHAERTLMDEQREAETPLEPYPIGLVGHGVQDIVGSMTETPTGNWISFELAKELYNLEPSQFRTFCVDWDRGMVFLGRCYD